MYRQSQQEKQRLNMAEAGGNQIQFLNRMGSLPLVTTAIGQLGSLYNHTKDTNRLMRYTFETAESTVKAVAGTAMPVISKTLPIGTIDSFACSQLERLEQSYPVVTRPTDQIVAETKNIYNSTLKPTVDRVTGMKDYGVTKVSDIKDYGVERLSTMKDFGMDKVGGVKAYGMDKLMVGSTMLNTVLVSTEYYVDQYLPAEEGAKETEDVIKPDAYPLTRLGHLSDKVRRRMFARAMQELQHAQKRSTETLEKLTFTVNLLEYSRTHIDGVKSKVSDGREKLYNIWQEVNRTEEDVAKDQMATKDDVTAPTFEQRAIATARHLTWKLKHSYGAVSSYAHLMPGNVMEKIAESKKYTDELYHTLSNASTYHELPRHTVDHMRATLESLMSTTSQLTDSMLQTRAVGWLALFRFTLAKPAPTREASSPAMEEKLSSAVDHKETSSPVLEIEQVVPLPSSPEHQLPKKEATTEEEKLKDSDRTYHQVAPHVGITKKKDLEEVSDRTEAMPQENGRAGDKDVPTSSIPTPVKKPEVQKLPPVTATVPKAQPEGSPTAAAGIPKSTQEVDGGRMKKKKVVKPKSKIPPTTSV